MPLPSEQPDPVVLGLAGGIGSGKSKVASIFAELGWLVVDYDRKVREQLDRPDVKQTLVDWWGPTVLTAAGGLDRAAVAGIVFQDPAQLHRLESLLHPLVLLTRAQAQQLARDAEARGIVLDAPLLFESGQDAACDSTLFVDAKLETRVNRVKTHRGWTRQELLRREANQMPIEEKKARCRHIIRNEPEKNDLRSRVAELSAILTG